MRTYQARGLPSKIIAWIIMLAMCIGLAPMHIDTAYAASTKPSIRYIELRDNGKVIIYGAEASSGAKITQYGISKKFGSNGAFEFKPDGGDTPYRWQTSNTFTNLTSAAYNFWVKDANGVMSDSTEFIVFRRADIKSNKGVNISGVYDGNSNNPCKVPIGQKVDVWGYFTYEIDFTVSWSSSITTDTFRVQGTKSVEVNEGKDILSAYDNTKAGTVSIPATLLGQTGNISVQFYDTPMSIVAQTYQKEFWEGEDYTAPSGTALVTWASGKKETVQLADVLFRRITNLSAGNNQKMELYYIGRDSNDRVVGTVEGEYYINVKARPRVTAKTVVPNKTQYYIGDAFDNTGTFNITWKDGTVDKVPLSRCTVTNFSTTSASAGKYITVQYTPTKDGYEGGVVSNTSQYKVYYKPITVTVKTVGATQADKTYNVPRTTASTVNWTLPTPTTIQNKTFKGYSTSNTGTNLKNAGTAVGVNADSTYYAIYEDTPVLNSISVTGAKTDYNVGDTFVEQGNVVKNYSSGPAQTTPLKESMISGFDTSTAGTKPVTVSLESKTTTYDINVVDNNKAPYIIADQCEHGLSTDGKIKVVAADDDGRIVEYGYSPITIFPSTECDASHATWQTSDTFYLPSGAYWFYVKDDKGAISEHVRLRSLPYDEITGLQDDMAFKAPTKLDYSVGDNIDTTGGVFYATWDDHGQVDADGTPHFSNSYKWSIDLKPDMLESYDNTKPGTVTITAHPYNDKFTGTFDVTFTDPVTSIAVLNPKTAYSLNDTFTEQGTVEVTYTSGSTSSVPLTEDLISGFDTSTTGTKPITVTYEGKTASYDITVSDSSTPDPGPGTGPDNPPTPGDVKHTVTLLTGNLFTNKFADKESYTVDDGDDFDFPEPDDSSRKFLGYTPTMSMIWHDGIDTYMPGDTITVDENKTFYRLYNQAPFLKYIDQDGYGTVTMVADDIDGTIDEYGYTQSGGESSVDNWQADNEFTGLDSGNYTFYAKDNQGATVKAEVDVILKDDGITFNSFDTPDKVDYLIGEDLDLTGSGFWFDMPEESNIPTGFVRTAPSMLSDYDNTVEGTVSITATCFDEYTGDFDVTFSNAVVSIEVVDAQTEYNVDDEFVEQGTVILTYADGTTDEIPLTEDLVSSFDTSKPGDSLLEVTYNDPTSGDIVDNVPITITDTGNNADKEIDYIEVSGVTTEYEQDDPFDGRGTVTIHYTDGTEETKPLDESLLEGFDTSEPGTITVTVKVGDSETTYDIEVSESTPDDKEITSIEVSGVTTEYDKDAPFDGKGTVTIHYADGTDETKPITDDMLSGFDTSEPGTVQVTVTTDGKSTDYTITVKDKAPEQPEAPKATSIILNNMQTDYYVGDNINLAGSTATITYEDGTTKEVPITADMVTGFTTTTKGTRPIVVAIEGLDATHNIVVSEKGTTSGGSGGSGGSSGGNSGGNSGGSSGGGSHSGGGGGSSKPSTTTKPETEIKDGDTPLIETPDIAIKDDAPGKDVYGQQFKLKSGVHVANGLENGYIAGYKDKTFKPTNSITRAEFAAILYRVFNFDNQTITCDFEDVPDGIWYEQAVGVLASRNVIYGVGGNKFAPQQNITVEQALLMLGRIVDVSKYNGVRVEGNTDLVLANVKKVINSGIAKGFEGLDLKSNITREQAVTFINNIIYSSLDTSKVNQFTDINESMKTYRDIVKASLVKEGDVGYVSPTPQIAQIAPVAEIEPAQQENAHATA